MDQSFDLRLKIKEFLSKQPQFRNPTFDPAPFLISILKEKQGDRESLQDKQNQLIEIQNQCRDLIDDICSEHSEEFLKFIEVPQFYAQNLQKMKSNVSVVKKKVKEAKALLMNTQKDIQQVHYNCMYNKIVHKKLKEIQLRLVQYETASIALKNNQFLLCSFNLPHLEGGSILESALTARAQTLRLRMLTKAIDEINLFLFLIPKVILPSNNTYFQRISGNSESESLIGNWEQHRTFYKRYKLFQKIDWKDYLAKIWGFDDLERKEGKLGKIYNIIKAVINVGRLDQITSSTQINGKKQIGNLFILLKYFRIKDFQQSKQNIPDRWFFDYCTYNQDSKLYISAIFCLIGVLFRKNMILHKIYEEFMYSEYKFHNGAMYDIVLAEIQKLIQSIYFPIESTQTDNGFNEGNAEAAFEDSFSKKIGKIQSYINFGYSGYVMRKSLKLIEQNIYRVSSQIFEREADVYSIKGKGQQIFHKYHEKFYHNFHKDFCETLKDIFQGDGRIFLTQTFQSIICQKQFNDDEIKYMKAYRSDDKKAIKEYVFSVSLLKALEEFFTKNHLQKQLLYKYTLLVINLFYLKLNYHFTHNAFSGGELQIIREQRKTDKKLKKKEEEFYKTYYKIAPEKQIQAEIQKKQSIHPSTEKSKGMGILGLLGKSIGSNDSNSQRYGPSQIVSNILAYNLLDKFRVFQRQNEMLFSFSTHFFNYIEEHKRSKNVIDYYEEINKLEPANYEENIEAKITMIWDSLPKSQVSLKEYTVAVLHKLFGLACIVNTKIFRDGGG